MKRFQFPLDRVRRWRAEQATLEELKLEQLVERMTRLRDQKRAVESARIHSEQDVLGRPSIEAIDLQSLDAFRLHTRDKIRDLERQEREAGTAVDEQRQRVMQARRAAELLERLKRRSLDAWQAASDHEQESLATELYLAKRARQR